MITKFIEACDGTNFNWGKFMVARFTNEELSRPIHEPVARAMHEAAKRQYGPSLLNTIGWNAHCVLVFDLQTCEGASFRPGGSARADLQKHQVWVCPMFEPFLEWLYKQDLTDLEKLPDFINLGNVPTAMYGHRRPGPHSKDSNE